MHDTKHSFKQMLVAGLAFGCLMTAPAFGSAAFERYIPPEVLHARDLKQVVAVPYRVDVNHASLNQLKVIPGFDESLALKIMRVRPLKGIQDFYELPGISRRDLDLMIQSLTPRLEFK